MTEKVQNINELLSRLRKLGIKLQVDKGRLRIDAPKGVLSSSLREELSQHKDAIIQYVGNKEFLGSEEFSPIPLLSREGALSVSFSQERLWFLSQLEPENAAYNISGGVRLEGQLQVDIFKQSFAEIVTRHEALRTTIEEIDGKPVQVISNEAEFELPVEDLQELPEAERETRTRKIITEEAQRPFDLSAGPLFRAVLVQLSLEEHILVVVMHHIITDGWSLGVFMRELEALYAAFSEGKPSPLPDLPIQYADYAAWQRERLQGEVLEGQVAYWKDQLGGELTQLQLPTDRPRPAVQTHRGARHGFDLPKGLAEKINTLRRQQGVTLFMTLLAAFKVLLYRYTGQTDFEVGTPIANRTRPELEGLIGFFVNTLVLRTDMSGDPGFVEFLGRVRETTLGAYDHQELPFEKLVEVLNPVRDMSYSPLFQVMFVLQNMPMSTVELPRVKLSPVAVDTGTSMFDLTLYMWEGERGLSGSIEYNADLFDADTIERMVGQFETLLESIVSDPTRRLSELELLTEVERYKLLVGWNTTEAEYPADKSLVQLFEEQVARSPEAVAVEYERKQLSYRELNDRANQLAHYLQSKGIGPESRVGIWMERSPDMMVALLGALKAGGAYVPLDPSYPQARLAFMLSDAQAPVLLTRQRFIKDLPEYAGQVVCLDRDWGAISKESAECPASRIKPDSAVYVVYTSGSTGTPKGVIGLHRGAVNRLNWMWRVYPFNEGEVCCQKTYLSFVDSVWEIFGPLLKGVPTVIISEDEVKDPHLLVESLMANHVSRVVLVPSLLRVLLDVFDDLQKRISKLRLWVTSGEEIPLELAKRFREAMPQARLINLYGSSEVSADVTFYEIGDDFLGQRVPIGRPIDNSKVYVLDAYLQPVPVGVRGELYVGGAGLARGYFNREDLTAERFVVSPFRRGEVLFRTGDLGRYLSDGNIEYVGRRDHQVKVRGFRVELGEIESRVKEVEALSDCVVVLREDRPEDTRLVAYYVEREGQSVEVSEIRRYLQSKLPDYMVPQHFVKLGSMPLTPNGKVDRKALPRPETMNTTEETEPKTLMEKMIAEVWKGALNVERVSVYDNFFEIGGHSLLSVQVIAQLQKKLGVRIKPRDFIYQSLGQLSASLDTRTMEVESTPMKISEKEIDFYFFKTPFKRLFGCHHWPESSRNKKCAIVLCYPIGQEYIRAHRAFYQLACRLSNSGFHVFRFDYYGTGDSEGDFEEASLEIWIDDIRAAVSQTQERSGVRHVCLVGLRLGAALCMKASSGNPDITSVILWDPALDGNSYLEELGKIHQHFFDNGESREKSKLLQRSKNDEFLGFPFSANLQKEIIDLNFENFVVVPKLRVLTIFNEEKPLVECQLGSFWGRHRNIESKVIKDFREWEFGPVRRPPLNTINFIIEWLEKAHS